MCFLRLLSVHNLKLSDGEAKINLKRRVLATLLRHIIIKPRVYATFEQSKKSFKKNLAKCA